MATFMNTHHVWSMIIDIAMNIDRLDQWSKVKLYEHRSSMIINHKWHSSRSMIVAMKCCWSYMISVDHCIISWPLEHLHLRGLRKPFPYHASLLHQVALLLWHAFLSFWHPGDTIFKCSFFPNMFLATCVNLQYVASLMQSCSMMLTPSGNSATQVFMLYKISSKLHLFKRF